MDTNCGSLSNLVGLSTLIAIFCGIRRSHYFNVNTSASIHIAYEKQRKIFAKYLFNTFENHLNVYKKTNKNKFSTKLMTFCVWHTAFRHNDMSIECMLIEMWQLFAAVIQNSFVIGWLKVSETEIAKKNTNFFCWERQAKKFSNHIELLQFDLMMAQHLLNHLQLASKLKCSQHIRWIL